MSGLIKKSIKKIFQRLVSNNLTSEEFVSDLRKKGIQIGNKTKFFDPISNVVDVTRPWMLKIGSYCKITHGVIILAHDYSRSVLRRSHNAILAEGKDTVLGDNIFIGMNAIILAGTHIGNNVIVGAGSVVSGNVPDNVVIAGNPARIIKTMDEYYLSRKEHNIDEAKNCCRLFYFHYKRFPTVKEMGHFFPLYLNSEEQIKMHGIDLNWSGDEPNEILQSFLDSDHPYKDFESFCKDCITDENA